MLKNSLFLRNLQTSQENNSRILRMKDAKFSGHCCFYRNTNIYRDFQICISVPLNKKIWFWVARTLLAYFLKLRFC